MSRTSRSASRADCFVAVDVSDVASDVSDVAVDVSTSRSASRRTDPWNLLHGAATRTARVGKRIQHDGETADDADETAQSFEEAIVFEFLRS